jgi:uncharacterized protein DUF5615
MKAFTIKLDENLSRDHARFLKDLGYKADRVHDQGLSGASDDAVWERVVSEGRFLITLDLDFSDIRRFQPGSHPGILLVRARSKGHDWPLATHCYPKISERGRFCRWSSVSFSTS